MKSLVKLHPLNHKGFNFINKQGLFHNCKIKKDKFIIHDRNNKKIIIDKNDKRFSCEKYTIKAELQKNSFTSHIDYFE